MAGVINTTLLLIVHRTDEDWVITWPTNVSGGTIDFTGITDIKCQLFQKQGTPNCPSEIDFTGEAISMDSDGNLSMSLPYSAFSAIDDEAIYVGEVLIKIPGDTPQNVVTHKIEARIYPAATQW